MAQSSPKRLDIYSELCPVSSATIIGAGLVTVTMGSLVPGLAFIGAGIVVGFAAGPLSKKFTTPKPASSRN